MACTYKLKLWILLGAPLAVAGCGTSDNFPLIFGQTQTVGLSIGGSTTDQGAELVLGFKDKNIAIIPVTIRQSNGDSTQVQSVVGGAIDAMSVLGQFELGVKNDAATLELGLGKFFATGLAAQKLADGFRVRLSKVQP